MTQTGLRSRIPSTAVHLCVDMQNIFAPGGIWAVPWMPRVAPVVEELVAHRPQQTIFTRFVTPERAEEMPGTWRNYYRKWADTTRERIDPAMLDLLPPLKRFVPPATIIDKSRYSAFAGSGLVRRLQERETDTLIVTGSETDVCVLSTVLDAVDLGLRTIVVTDAICSSSDEGHDALLTVYRERYSEQIETSAVAEVIAAWA